MGKGWRDIFFTMPVFAVLTQPQSRQCLIRAYQQPESKGPSRALFIVIGLTMLRRGAGPPRLRVSGQSYPLHFAYGHIQVLAPWLWRLKIISTK